MESITDFEPEYKQLTWQYEKLAQTYKKQSKLISRKMIQSGWMRVLVFVLLFAAPIYLYPLHTWLAIASFTGLCFAFFLLIRRFNKLKKKKNELLSLISLNQQEVQAQLGDWSSFCSGEHFINPHHHYSHDLDLFGTGSFFQYINRTTTLKGEEELQARLCSPETDTEIIKENQSVIKELAEKLIFRQHFYAKGRSLNETQEDINKIKTFESYHPLLINKGKSFKLLITVLPVFCLLSIGLTFIGVPSAVPVTLFLLNITFASAYSKKVSIINAQFTSLSNILNKFALLISLIDQEEFKSKTLLANKERLKNQSRSASQEISQLSSFMKHFDQRKGMITGPLLNGFLLWDFIYVLKIEKWLNKYSNNIKEWLRIVYEIDALNSMAGFVYNHPDYTFPKPDSKIILKVSNIGHPLINRQERVCNHFDFDKSIFTLITGANMSGKSTFLRTVGLNMILARCGMTVCATDMTFKPMKMITNMRTTDSLIKHESYFFAELKRLKFIIDHLKEGIPIFIILDEILKGTNSKDKTYGSLELIKNLLSLNATGMIATHDLELGILEKETKGKIINQCFEVENIGNELKFDYKLHKGITQNHNASFLMKQMGIIAAN
jgi:hypothetical protein